MYELSKCRSYKVHVENVERMPFKGIENEYLIVSIIMSMFFAY